MKMSIIAAADIHSPYYLPLFSVSISSILNKEFDLIILAGDVVNNGNVDMVKPVVDVLTKFIKRLGTEIPIIAVFGNEEYIGLEEKFESAYPEIVWLNDEYVTLRIKNVGVCIAGSRGILRKPTSWQRRNIPDVEHMYEARLNKIKSILKECSRQSISILVTHYASTYVTLYGENPVIHNYLGYPVIESLPVDGRPKISIHGHAHNASRLYANVNGVDVYNVSLIARKGVTVINVNIVN
uniref:Metallophosphoesterase n=1 Tax=Ignisphaera aggregans TaxID=334771 RepID=A0A7J3JR71_9CREN